MADEVTASRPGPRRSRRQVAATFASVLAAMLLTACAGQRADGDVRYARYDGLAGAAVDDFPDSGRVAGWTFLRADAVVVWTQPDEAWLLDLASPCHDLADGLGLTLTARTGRVDVRDSWLVVSTRGPTGNPCGLRRIRPIEASTIPQAERRNQDTLPADQPPASGT